MPSNSTSFAIGHPSYAERPSTQINTLVRLLMKDAKKDDLKPVDRSMVARAVKELLLAKHQLRMLPFAKPIDVLPPLRGPGGRLMRRLSDTRGRTAQSRAIDVGSSAPTEAPAPIHPEPKKLDTSSETLQN
jgi:hypothetical protein